MPRVVRGYNHKDFSSLLDELRRGAEPEDVSGIEISDLKHQKPVTEDKRRRDSLMGNKNMRFAFSAKSRVVHDRDCPYLKVIADEDYRMLEEFPTQMKHCRRCFRRSVIRAALDPNDYRYMEAYERIFDLIGAMSYEMHILFVEFRGKLCGVGKDFVCIHVDKDTWMICVKNGKLLLYHNSYTVNSNYERIFTKGYHLQEHSGRPSFRNCIRIMTGYSWDRHISSMRAQDTPAEVYDDGELGISE